MQIESEVRHKVVEVTLHSVWVYTPSKGVALRTAVDRVVTQPENEVDDALVEVTSGSYVSSFG